MLRKITGELVDIDSFVVLVNVSIIECVLWYEIHDIVLCINTHHRTVHPTLIFGDKGKVGVGIV